MRKRISLLEERAINILEQRKIFNFVREYRFHPTKKWRFDLAIPDKMIGIELEGAIWIRGRHNRGLGYTHDCEKYNQAAVLGWKILRYTDLNCYSLLVDLIALGL